MSKMPCTLGENDYRIVVAAQQVYHEQWLRLIYSGGKYFVHHGRNINGLEDAFKSMLNTMQRGYEYCSETPVVITMTSPTDEERATIMRVWNEWQEQQKEEVNE